MTIADLEVAQLEAHLRVGGWLTAFTDILGNAQPSPIFQPYELDLTKGIVTNDDRIVMIRETGGVSNAATRVLFKQKNMVVSVVGKPGVSDLIIVKGLAQDMEEWLVANPQDGMCLTNIVSSGVSGPFITEDSRRVFEINLNVTFNINIPQFT